MLLQLSREQWSNYVSVNKSREFISTILEKVFYRKKNSFLRILMIIVGKQSLKGK